MIDAVYECKKADAAAFYNKSLKQMLQEYGDEDNAANYTEAEDLVQELTRTPPGAMPHHVVLSVAHEGCTLHIHFASVSAPLTPPSKQLSSSTTTWTATGKAGTGCAATSQLALLEMCRWRSWSLSLTLQEMRRPISLWLTPRAWRSFPAAFAGSGRVACLIMCCHSLLRCGAWCVQPCYGGGEFVKLMDDVKIADPLYKDSLKKGIYSQDFEARATWVGACQVQQVLFVTRLSAPPCAHPLDRPLSLR